MPLWTPAALGSNLRFWLQADALTLDDDDPVASWTDSTANGLHAANATADDQPSFQTNEINGLPVVRFDGTSDDLSITSLGLSKPCTIALLIRIVEAVPSNGDRLFQAGNSLSAVVGGSGVNDFRTGTTPNFQYSTDTLDTDPHVHVISFAGTGNSTGSFDGVAATGDAGTAAPGTTMILASTGTAGFLQADYGEIMGINGAISTGERHQLEGYLAHKWGIEANLPGDHPYLTTAPQRSERTGLGYPLGGGLRQRTLG